MVFLRVTLFFTFAKSEIPCRSWLTPYTKTQQKYSQQTYTCRPKLFGGGGLGGESLKSNTFCRLGLSFATGAKINDIIAKHVQTRRFGFSITRSFTVVILDRAINNNVACLVVVCIAGVFWRASAF